MTNQEPTRWEAGQVFDAISTIVACCQQDVSRAARIIAYFARKCWKWTPGEIKSEFGSVFQQAFYAAIQEHYEKKEHPKEEPVPCS